MTINIHTPPLVSELPAYRQAIASRSCNILITGGTGSLGTAILQRAEEDSWIANLTVIARNESRINKVRARFPHVRCEIGDVRDQTWLETVFRDQDYIIHAAANKIVPSAEANVRETILTNIGGSMNVAMAAVQCGVRRVVGVSTDKACQAETMYGHTKALMEGLFREANTWANTWGTTRFITCRYGNVLRSNASVVPFFEAQMARGEPFTVTSRDMTRFWLSMPQAVDLVLECLLSSWNGVTVVPRAPAMRLMDLVRLLDPQREIVEIGVRPGEKMHEKLIHAGEASHTQVEGDRFIIYPPRDISQIPVLKALPPGFEYTSDGSNAPHLTPEQMRDMLDEWYPEVL